MAPKEKVQIKRSDQFQEVDEELSKAMADLDSTIERVNVLLQTGSIEAEESAAEDAAPVPEMDADGDAIAEAAAAPEKTMPESTPIPKSETAD